MWWLENTFGGFSTILAYHQLSKLLAISEQSSVIGPLLFPMDTNDSPYLFPLIPSSLLTMLRCTRLENRAELGVILCTCVWNMCVHIAIGRSESSQLCLNPHYLNTRIIFRTSIHNLQKAFIHLPCVLFRFHLEYCLQTCLHYSRLQWQHL